MFTEGHIPGVPGKNIKQTIEKKNTPALDIFQNENGRTIKYPRTIIINKQGPNESINQTRCGICYLSLVIALIGVLLIYSKKKQTICSKIINSIFIHRKLSSVCFNDTWITEEREGA